MAALGADWRAAGPLDGREVAPSLKLGEGQANGLPLLLEADAGVRFERREGTSRARRPMEVSPSSRNERRVGEAVPQARARHRIRPRPRGQRRDSGASDKHSTWPHRSVRHVYASDQQKSNGETAGSGAPAVVQPSRAALSLTLADRFVSVHSIPSEWRVAACPLRRPAPRGGGGGRLRGIRWVRCIWKTERSVTHGTVPGLAQR